MHVCMYVLYIKTTQHLLFYLSMDGEQVLHGMHIIFTHAYLICEQILKLIVWNSYTGVCI